MSEVNFLGESVDWAKQMPVVHYRGRTMSVEFRENHCIDFPGPGINKTVRKNEVSLICRSP